MTTRNDRERRQAREQRARRPALNRQAIQGGLAQPSRHHDLEDKQ
ncbi:hypothetical protein [Halomonas nitroreducens]|nr:hypothetical protein [Halomonas nitroreducens]